MKTFSERKGIKPIADVVQTTWMSDELRNSLWNVLAVAMWSTDDFMYRQYGQPGMQPFSQALWFHYFKEPIDSRPDRSNRILEVIRNYFFKCTWNEVYDFLEFVVAERSRSTPKLADFLNFVLERELSGYRIASGVVVDITSDQELAAIEEAATDSRFAGPAGHIRRALELYADRETPDYRNSIKESILAVESMARVISRKEKATLGDALKAVERN